jgi:hypothetical protein
LASYARVEIRLTSPSVQALLAHVWSVP